VVNIKPANLYRYNRTDSQTDHGNFLLLSEARLVRISRRFCTGECESGHEI